VLAATTALAGVGLLVGAGPASAADNGQQVSISTRYSDYVTLCGLNQDSAYICTGWVPTPNYWTTVNSWWWKGEVDITGRQVDTANGNNNVYRYGVCWVPVAQPGDVTYCDLAGKL
ncbi:MAG: hypothetical protein ABIQ18_29270, partial [Umezawaea sp.]